MATKLTLRMDEKLIRRAKNRARRSGKSVSRLVGDFFVLLGAGKEDSTFEMTPRVKSLKGFFRGSKVDVSDYRRHLEDKYR